MSKKLHLTKLEEGETEVGVQLRDSNPPTGLENRIFINKLTGELRAHLNGADVQLSFNVYDIDPVIPTEKQVWINSTTRQLKWRYGGVTQSVSLDDAMKVANQGTLSGYLGTLSQVELEQIADVSSFLPNYLVDAFNGDVENSVLVNLVEKSSSIEVVDGQTSGTYDLEKRSSPAYNYAEGVAVIKSQALRPKTVTDNTDGTHTCVFTGDVTDILWQGGKLLAYEQQLDSQDIIESFFLLDGDLNPAQLEIGLVTYDNVLEETTAIITNNGLDISLGFLPNEYDEKLRFKPINLKVEASSDGSLGVMTEIQPDSVDGLAGLSAVLGEELFTKISTQLTLENVTNHRLEHSPNKQNWILQIVSENTDNGRIAATVNMWYSTDGLSTLDFVKNWVGYMTAASVDQVSWFNYQNYGYDMWFSNQQLKLNDDGRYVFAYQYFDPSSTWASIMYFGDLSRPNFEPVLFNGNFGGYAGTASFEQNATYSYHAGTLEVDWDYNMMILFIGRTNEDAYIQLYEIDWDNNNTYPRSYFGLGTDFFQYPVQGISFIKEFEGETQWFGIFEHGTNQLCYAWKFRYRRLIDEVESGVYTGLFGVRGNTGAIQATVSPSDGDRYVGGAISNSLEGGNRFETANYMHQRDQLRPVDWGFDTDDDTLIILSEDTNQSLLFLHGINFGRTTYGAPNETDLSFDLEPDSGNFTLDVTDVLTTTTETTSPIPFSADINQITSILEAITFIGVGNVEVTGSFASGFEIRLSLFRRQEIHFVLNTNSLTQTATPVVITVNELEGGFRPVWLRHDNHPHNSELYNPANGLVILLDDDRLAQYTNYAGDKNHNDYSRERTLGQSLWVRGKSVIAHTITRSIGLGHDMNQPTLIKVPDYTQCYGYGIGTGDRKVSIGTNVESILLHKSRMITAEDWGTRFAQRFNSSDNPYSMYADGKIHLRTMMLYLHPEEVIVDGIIRRPTRDGDEIKMRIMPLGVGGLPDWDNPIAISSGVKWNNLPNKNDTNWVPFTFPNVKLEPNTEYFFGIESLGIDFESEVPSDSAELFQLHIASRDLVTNNTYFKYQPDDGGWVSGNEQIWYKWYDYYFNYTHNLHESGYNHGVKQFRHEWWDGGCTFEATIHPRVVDTSQTYLASYRYTGGLNNDDENIYSNVEGGSHNYVFEIDDTGNAEDMPIVKDPEILGWEGSDMWDRHLVYAVAFGVVDDYSMQLNADGSRQLGSSDPDDLIHNHSTHFGGFRLDYEHAELSARNKEFTGLSYGMEDDPDFRYGRCYHFDGVSRAYIYNHSIDMTPSQHDFVWECEYKVEPEDLDGSNNMLIGSNQMMYIGIIYGRLAIYIYSNVTGYHVVGDPLLTTGYQRLRVTRDWDNGIRLWRNYDSVGGTWEELISTGYKNTVTGDFYKHGAQIGDSDYTRVYYAIGGWTEAGDYYMKGRMGYMKMAIGSSEFAYDGINFDQRPSYKVVNHGEFITSLKVRNNGDPNILIQATADYGIYKHKVKSAKVRSNYTVLKYKATIASGRKMATKLTLYKASDSDPSAVDGYLMSFYRK